MQHKVSLDCHVGYNLSIDTPKKKAVEDFTFGAVLGEGAYGAVCIHSLH